jgi:hypothetical protein
VYFVDEKEAARAYDAAIPPRAGGPRLSELVDFRGTPITPVTHNRTRLEEYRLSTKLEEPQHSVCTIS